MVVLLFIFWGTSIPFSKLCQFIFLPVVYRVSFLPRPCQCCCFLSFGNSHSNRCEVIISLWFCLHFLDDEWCWASFHVFFGHLFSLEKCLLLSSSHFLIMLFWCWLVWIICTFCILTPYQMICSYFLPFTGLPFLFFLDFFWMWATYKVISEFIVVLLFYVLVFWPQDM